MSTRRRIEPGGRPSIERPARLVGSAGDASNGYDAVASRFVRGRRARIGVAVLREWARRLPPGAAVLDLGCGHGVPVTRTLVRLGLAVQGVDASPRLVAEFRRRLPGVPVTCEPLERSVVLDGAFDGVVAVGVVFLLPAVVQRDLVSRMARALRPGGRLLFTAPVQAASWDDALTGRRSTSLGGEVYRRLLQRAGLAVEAEMEDEGGNHYYAAWRGAAGRAPRLP